MANYDSEIEMKLYKTVLCKYVNFIPHRPLPPPPKKKVKEEEEEEKKDITGKHLRAKVTPSLYLNYSKMGDPRGRYFFFFFFFFL